MWSVAQYVLSAYLSLAWNQVRGLLYSPRNVRHRHVQRRGTGLGKSSTRNAGHPVIIEFGQRKRPNYLLTAENAKDYI